MDMNTLILDVTQLVFLAGACLLVMHGIHGRSKTQATRFNWSVGLPVNKNKDRKEKKHMLDIKITNEQKISVRVAPVTATGKEAALDGAVEFVVESGNCTIEPIDDRSAFIVSGDTPGDSVVIVKADADLGEGVEVISDVIRVAVEGARAASLGLTLGEPVAK